VADAHLPELMAALQVSFNFNINFNTALQTLCLVVYGCCLRLQINTTLQTLRLCNNKITDEGARLLGLGTYYFNFKSYLLPACIRALLR
jgi:hypothetical protein